MKLFRSNRKPCDCVIVATLNALIWQDKYMPYAEIEALAKKHHSYDPETGFGNVHIRSFFNRVGLTHRGLSHIKWADLERYVLNGNGALLSYSPKNGAMAHMVFLSRTSDGTTKIMNSNFTLQDIIKKCTCEEMNLNGVWVIGKAV